MKHDHFTKGGVINFQVCFAERCKTEIANGITVPGATAGAAVAAASALRRYQRVCSVYQHVGCGITGLELEDMFNNHKTNTRKSAGADLLNDLLGGEEVPSQCSELRPNMRNSTLLRLNTTKCISTPSCD
jgi:hypothetical protein